MKRNLFIAIAIIVAEFLIAIFALGCNTSKHMAKVYPNGYYSRFKFHPPIKLKTK